MSEVLTSMKFIKFYTWKNYYRKKIIIELEIDEIRCELIFKIAEIKIHF